MAVTSPPGPPTRSFPGREKSQNNRNDCSPGPVSEVRVNPSQFNGETDRLMIIAPIRTVR